MWGPLKAVTSKYLVALLETLFRYLTHHHLCPTPDCPSGKSSGEFRTKDFWNFSLDLLRQLVLTIFSPRHLQITTKGVLSSGVCEACLSMYVIYLKGTHVLGHFYYGNEGRDKFSLCQQGQHPTPTLTQMRWMPSKRLIPYNRRPKKAEKQKQ